MLLLNRNRNRNLNLNPPTLADPTRRRFPAHAGANASNIQALLPILALDAVARVCIRGEAGKSGVARHRFEE